MSAISPAGELITQVALKEILHYDPDTGLFTFIKKVNRKLMIGQQAGYLNKGYVLIKLNGTMYRAHRLAWLYVYGEWPELIVDHINGVGADNRIANLRLVTFTGNAQNRKKIAVNNTSGHMGVQFTRNKTWAAKIKHMGLAIHLGCFASKDEAIASYIEAKKKLHPHQTQFA
jgi:hypothetical protein